MKLSIEKAAKERGINTQIQLLELIEKKTSVKMRPSTLSAMYRNNQTTVNKEHLTIIMKTLNITDFNEILETEG